MVTAFIIGICAACGLLVIVSISYAIFRHIERSDFPETIKIIYFMGLGPVTAALMYAVIWNAYSLIVVFISQS